MVSCLLTLLVLVCATSAWGWAPLGKRHTTTGVPSTLGKRTTRRLSSSRPNEDEDAAPLKQFISIAAELASTATKIYDDKLSTKVDDQLKQWAKTFEDKVGEFGKSASSSSSSPKTKGKDEELAKLDSEIAKATTVLEAAAETKKEDPDAVVAALLDLEKLMRARNKADEDLTSKKTLEKLNGSWRLIFTTGTVDTQKKLGRINYFPIKAVQSFDTADFKISNGIYAGDYAVLKFFGPFSWNVKARKLEFDFDSIAVFGFRFNLPQGGAAKIGQQTGLGSENNVELVKANKKPFFNWVLASDKIAVARGGGGGLALWKRDAAMQAQEGL